MRQGCKILGRGGRDVLLDEWRIGQLLEQTEIPILKKKKKTVTTAHVFGFSELHQKLQIYLHLPNSI